VNRNTQTAVGVALVIAGAYCIHEAWEGRGRRRPFLLSLLPG
jgi:hypothetical protein